MLFIKKHYVVPQCFKNYKITTFTYEFIFVFILSFTGAILKNVTRSGESSEKRHKEGGVYRWELIATAQYVGDP